MCCTILFNLKRLPFDKKCVDPISKASTIVFTLKLNKQHHPFVAARRRGSVFRTRQKAAALPGVFAMCDKKASTPALLCYCEDAEKYKVRVLATCIAPTGKACGSQMRLHLYSLYSRVA